MFQNFDRQDSKINVRFYFNWNEVTTASIAVNCAIVEVPISVKIVSGITLRSTPDTILSAIGPW